MSIITKQQLENATLDADTLEKVVNGSATLNTTGQVTSRLGTVLKTLKRLTTDLEAVDIASLAATLINGRIDTLEDMISQFESTALLLKPDGLLKWNSPDIFSGEISISSDKKTIYPVAGYHPHHVRMSQKLPIRGKYYVEFNSMANLTGCFYGGIGMVKTNIPLTENCNSSIQGSWRQYCHGGILADGTVFQLGTGTGVFNQNFAVNQRFAMAIDMTAGKLWVGLGDGNWSLFPSYPAGSNPTTGDVPHATFTPGDNFYVSGGMYNGPSSNPPWRIPIATSGVIPAGYATIN